MGVVAYKGKFYAGSINEDTKADITAIAYNEDGATCKNPNGYTVGEHFYKDGKFCTAIAAIASGATFTLNTNYVEGTIADNIPKTKEVTYSHISNSSSTIYYVLLDSDVLQSLGATKILGFYVSGFSNFSLQATDGVLPSNVGMDTGRLYLLFPTGKTFSNLSLSVTYTYI